MTGDDRFPEERSRVGFVGYVLGSLEFLSGTPSQQARADRTVEQESSSIHSTPTQGSSVKKRWHGIELPN